MIHTPAVPAPHHSYPAAMCSLYFICLPKLEWQQPESELPSCSPSPFIFMLQRGIKYPSWFHAGKKKGEKNIQEMKVVTRSSVCQTSPWAGTKGPERGCWACFTLHRIEEQGRRKKIKMCEELGWSEIIYREGGGEGAAVMNSSV